MSNGAEIERYAATRGAVGGKRRRRARHCGGRRPERRLPFLAQGVPGTLAAPVVDEATQPCLHPQRRGIGERRVADETVEVAQALVVLCVEQRPERNRLVHRDRRDVGAAARDQQRDQAPVRVPDEVGRALDQSLDRCDVEREVDDRLIWPRRSLSVPRKSGA